MKRNFFNKITKDNSSILPIIIKIIKENLPKRLKLLKLTFPKLYISEFTVFIIVKIPNLNDVSKSKLEIVNKIVIRKREIIKIIIAKKYLFISAMFALILFRESLLEYIWFGLEWDNKLLIENLINVITFITLSPELVEKNDPPNITSKRKTKKRFLGISVKEIPIFETLLQIETRIFKKLLS